MLCSASFKLLTSSEGGMTRQEVGYLGLSWRRGTETTDATLTDTLGDKKESAIFLDLPHPLQIYCLKQTTVLKRRLPEWTHACSSWGKLTELLTWLSWWVIHTHSPPNRNFFTYWGKVRSHLHVNLTCRGSIHGPWLVSNLTVNSKCA